MASTLISDIRRELQAYFKPPQTFIKSLVYNSAISMVFFFASYYTGSLKVLLPFAVTTVLLWTLSDPTISNQFVVDKPKYLPIIKQADRIKHTLMVNSIALVVLSFPITLIYGLILALITDHWSGIFYWTILACSMVWGWLGIGYLMSAVLPFRMYNFGYLVKNRKQGLSFGFMYVLPWVILPVYAVIIGIPFYLLHWNQTEATQSHRFLTVMIILSASFATWLIGIHIAAKQLQKSNNRVAKYLA